MPQSHKRYNCRAANAFSRYNKETMNGGHMLPEMQRRTYEAFLTSTTSNEILDQKTTVMVQLAAAFVIGCYP